MTAPASFGKYMLLRELGRGGMGIVYEAVDSTLNRKVALKTMVPNPLQDPELARQERERFLREGQLAARLPKHPHLVGLYEAGVVEGRRYLAMELVDGRPLAEWAAAGASLRDRVAVLRDAARAVHHAHEQGVIHRDLKPANILVDGRSRAHVTDFGLAKMVGQDTQISITSPGFIVGTPAYISPEQAQGLKSTDRRTDIYALGVMLYEAITGRPPFMGETAIEILMKAVKNPVPTPSTVLRNAGPVDPALERICLKALAKKPEERYATAEAFADDLTRWLDGREVKVVLPPRTRRSAAPARAGRTRLAAGAAALVLAVVGGLAWSRVGETRRREAADARAKEAEARLQQLRAKALPAVAVDASRLKPGAVGEYFRGTNFDVLALRRVEARVAFPGRAALGWKDMPTDFLSMRWSGWILVPETGQVIFQVRATDGVRLFVDDVEVLSNWETRPAAAVDAGLVFLEKGAHRLVLEQFQRGTQWSMELTWKPSTAAEAVPAPLLHDPARAVPFAAAKEGYAPSEDDRRGLPGAQEAETLKVLGHKGPAPGALPFGRGTGSLFWGPGKGDRLSLEFKAGPKDRTLVLGLARNRNIGTFRFSVNGTVIAEALDLYDVKGNFREYEFKGAPLRAGANVLEIEVLGSNPAATPWKPGDGVNKFGFDYLRLR
ncbi:MAG TPA: protein kinase [Planctomycetota bacterium]|nr:protein kinase [Planctomycetota bacterium]